MAHGARREAAGDRHRGLRRHVGDVRILAGRGDFAEDEERPVGFDLDRHMRLADVAVAQLVGDPGRQLVGGRAFRHHRADQRHGDVAAGVDQIGIGQAVLAEHDDAQAVAGIERIGLLRGDCEHRRGRSRGVVERRGAGSGGDRCGGGCGISVAGRSLIGRPAGLIRIVGASRIGAGRRRKKASQ